MRDVKTVPDATRGSLMRIPPGSHIGSVDLRVSGIDRALEFYSDLLGFQEIRREGSAFLFSASGAEPYQISLTELNGARPRPPRSTGLFHVAIRYPTRKALAGCLTRLIENGYALQGASDHAVSEALYLADPDGIGLELYVDRPREMWPTHGSEVAMVTEPLDVRGLLDEADGSQWNGIHPQTDIGHIHLQVSTLERSKEFYCNTLGFEITQSSYRGALFVSAGGYHHHIGLNTWSSLGASPPPPDATGLISYRIVTSADYLSGIASRFERLNHPFDGKGTQNQSPLRVHDPDGVAIDLM